MFSSVRNILFVSKYSPGTEFVAPSPLWLLLLLLRNILAPGLVGDGVTLSGTLLLVLRNIFVPKTARGKIQNYVNTADIIKSKVQSDIVTLLLAAIIFLSLSLFVFAQNVHLTLIICVLRFDIHNTNKS